MRIPSSSSSSSRTKVVTPCCTKIGLKRGPWTPEEDELLTNYISKEGEGRWRTLPKKAGLFRCGKSCRLRWMNYLRPSVKRGHISSDEEDLIVRLHRLLGSRSLKINFNYSLCIYQSLFYNIIFLVYNCLLTIKRIRNENENPFLGFSFYVLVIN